MVVDGVIENNISTAAIRYFRYAELVLFLLLHHSNLIAFTYTITSRWMPVSLVEIFLAKYQIVNCIV